MEREPDSPELALLPARLSLSGLGDDIGSGPLSPLRSPGRRLLRSDSTRLRTNVAEHVHRDLMPAGRLFSICLVSFELVAEAVVLLMDWTPKCEFPLKSWTVYLMCLQTTNIALNLVSISYARILSRTVRGEEPREEASGDATSLNTDEPRPQTQEERRREESENLRRREENTADVLSRAGRVTRAVRMINALYLIWFIFGSVLVTQAGECLKTDPYLYRLVLALTVIYYGLLGLPLACFCFIICCLPCFIRLIPLYLTERSNLQSRAASSDRISDLPTTEYDPANFGDEEDASCVICLNPYEPGDRLRILPCKHMYHDRCVDQWLMIDKSCPLCKQDIDAGSNSDV